MQIEPGYPRAPQALGDQVGIPSLPIIISHYLYQQHHPDADIPEDSASLPPPPTRVHVFHSAAAMYYTPSDPSGIGGMHREHIRSTPSWRKGPRYDCVYVGCDPTAHGFCALSVAHVRLFIKFTEHSDAASAEPVDHHCAVVQWFSTIGDEPDEDTGLWAVEPDLDLEGQVEYQVIHVDSIQLRSAHLLPVFGDEPIPPYLSYTASLDSFRAYFVNRYADHHAHYIIF